MNPNKKKEDRSSTMTDMAESVIDLAADIVELSANVASTVVDHGCSAGEAIVESICDIGSFLD